MNEDPTLTRNLVRRELLPVLNRFNPQVVEALHRMGETLARDLAYLDRVAASSRLLMGEGWAAVPLGVLLSQPRPVADRLLLRAWRNLAGSGGPTAERMERMWQIVHGESRREQVGEGLVAERQGPMLVLRSEEVSQPEGPVALTPGFHRAGNLEFQVVLVEGTCRVAPLSKWAAIFPPTTALEVGADGVVRAGGEPAWIPGRERLAVAWYEPGSVGYLSVLAREECG
jgi:hypothetical protein